MTRARVRTTGGLLAVLVMAAAMLVASLSARPSKAGIPPTTSTAVSFSDEDSGLYQIDLNTGVATLLGVPGPFNIEGLTFGPNEGGGISLYAVDTDIDTLGFLFEVGPGVAIGPIVDEFGTPLDTDDVGLTFFGSQLLMSNVDATGEFTLYELLIPAGEAGDVVAIPIGSFGDLGQPVAGLASDGVVVLGLGGADDSLLVPTNNLVDVSPINGTSVEIGQLGLVDDLGDPVDVIDGGIDFDPFTGILWGIEDGESTGISHLFTIDPTTGAAGIAVPVTDTAGNPLIGFEGLAIFNEDEPVQPERIRLDGPTEAVVGDDLTYIATVTDQDGVPVEGFDVIFVVDEVIMDVVPTADGATDDGVAEFLYTPTEAGAFVITACLDTDFNQECGPAEPTASLTLTVTEDTRCRGEIQVKAKKLQFGDVRLKKSRLRSFNIKNVSKDEDLFIDEIFVEFPFKVVNGVGPIELGPGERRQVAVTFTPESRGKVRDTLTIFSSDCKAGDVTLAVVGKGVRRK